MWLRFVLILVLLGLATATDKAENEGVLRQKFIYEILLRVQDPLQFEEWISHGKSLVVDKSLYKKYDDWMDTFYESYQRGGLLPKGEFFGELVLSHMQEAKGLFHFFYYAENWETFQQNVCWARMNVNEGLFVYALSLAVLHGEWLLRTPAIYEIFPQHFFNSKFIQEAARFNYAAWSKRTLYEKAIHNYNNTQQPHTWQWWKQLGLAQRWYPAASTQGVPPYPSYWETDKKNNTKLFMPVDYTRDIKIGNMDAKMSYFMEDVEWCDSWYRFNLETSVLLPLEHSSQQDRSVAWLQTLQQYLARYKLERLSNGLGEMEDLGRTALIKTGYNPQMVSWNGLPFFQRPNNIDYKELSNSKTFQQLAEARDQFLHTFKEGTIVRNANGSIIDMMSSDGYKHFAQLLHGDADVLNDDFSNSFQLSVMMFNSQMDFDQFYGVEPNVLLNYETMLRDPLAYIIFKSKFLDYLRQYQQTLAPYKREQLLLEGVKFVSAEFSDIVTKFKFCDFDVSNLLNENMNFFNGQYEWDRLLMARQIRLGHNGFVYNITVVSDATHQVVVRLFIGPKYDEHGRVISLNENRWNFVEIDSFNWELINGTNFRKCDYNSDDLDRYDFDRLPYTDKYHMILKALNSNASIEKSSRRLHWTLPKGTPQGLPLQMFFVIQDINANLGTFPFEREFDDSQFFVPNMFLKEVKIYHDDDLEKFEDFNPKFFLNYY